MSPIINLRQITLKERCLLGNKGDLPSRGVTLLDGLLLGMLLILRVQVLFVGHLLRDRLQRPRTVESLRSLLGRLLLGVGKLHFV